MSDPANEQRRRAVGIVAEILEAAERYPWKTARYLSRRLREKEGLAIAPAELETALLEHSRSRDRVVRYSYFPARKSLDLLWGHVANVRDSETLPDPFLEPHRDFLEAAGEFEPCLLPETAQWCFLSHSFRDLDAVRGLRREILERGYGVWLAEAEILQGEMITRKVQEGLERSHRFVLFMTRRSLGSRWVLKEAGVAVHRWKLPPVVVVDGTDPDLVELFRPWIEAEWNMGRLSEGIDRLLIDANEEPAATRLPELLVAGLREVPREQRGVALYPDDRTAEHPGFLTLDQAFPSDG